jgi:hypothetical protein
MNAQIHGAACFGLAKDMSSMHSKLENGMIDECWTILSERLSILLSAYFSRLDDDLFRSSERAENNAMQNLYFESMRRLRVEREVIQKHYINGLKAVYQAYWAGKPVQEKLLAKPVLDNEDSFELLADDTLEEELAINGMIEKGVVFFRRELYALGKRFAELRGARKETDDNQDHPLAPAVLCHRFAAAIGSMGLDGTIKLVAYKLFDRDILSLFGPIYHEINAYLASQGILPVVSKLAKRPGRPADDGRLEGTHERDSEEAEIQARENAVYLDAFRSLQSLLDTWRGQAGVSSASVNANGLLFQSADVLHGLNALQQAEHVGVISNLAVQGESVKHFLAQRLANQVGEARGLGRQDEDIIDMVGMIFDFILDDNNLCVPIKGLIARLQIPIVKIAILDKTFFARKNNPARSLLNGLARAGIGLFIADGESDNPIYRKIEEIVGRILREFDQNLSLIEELLEDFAAFMDKEAKRSQVQEERTRQATQSKEKVWLAKKAVIFEVGTRLQGKTTPTSLRSFLYNEWKDVLMLAKLREEKTPGEWEKALAVMDRLIWSVIPPSTPAGRAEIVRAIPSLLKQVKEGLESISLDSGQIKELLHDLEACHLACLRAASSLQAKASTLAEVAASARTDETIIRDPQLAEAINEMKAELPDIENIGIEEIIVQGGRLGFLPHGNAASFAEAADDCFEKAKALKIGDWIEYLEGEKTLRARLSWRSPVTSLCVFVNQRGMKLAEMKANELAMRIRQGTVQLIEDASIPLTDRAVSALMDSLRNPFWRPRQFSA